MRLFQKLLKHGRYLSKRSLENEGNITPVVIGRLSAMPEII